MFDEWPDPVSRWLLTFVHAVVTGALAWMELRGLRSTRSHHVELLHVRRPDETYAAICTTCSWVGDDEPTVARATVDASRHSNWIGDLIEVDAKEQFRIGGYSRSE